jgi:hypothetical protein
VDYTVGVLKAGDPQNPVIGIETIKKFNSFPNM